MVAITSDPVLEFEMDVLKKGNCSNIDIDVYPGRVHITPPGGVGYTIHIPKDAKKVKFETRRVGDYIVEIRVKEVIV